MSDFAIAFTAIILIAIPLLYHCYRVRGPFNLLLYVLMVSGVAITVELVGVTSGGYTYSGQNLLMVTAFTGIGWLANTYLTMHMASYMLSGYEKELHFWQIITIAGLAALLGVMYDLFSDPVFVALGVWVWTIEGPWYGVPTLNFIGWFMILFLDILGYYAVVYYGENKVVKVVGGLVAVIVTSIAVIGVINLGLYLGIR